MIEDVILGRLTLSTYPPAICGLGLLPVLSLPSLEWLVLTTPTTAGYVGYWQYLLQLNSGYVSLRHGSCALNVAPPIVGPYCTDCGYLSVLRKLTSFSFTYHYFRGAILFEKGTKGLLSTLPRPIHSFSPSCHGGKGPSCA